MGLNLHQLESWISELATAMEWLDGGGKTRVCEVAEAMDTAYSIIETVKNEMSESFSDREN